MNSFAVGAKTLAAAEAGGVRPLAGLGFTLIFAGLLMWGLIGVGARERRYWGGKVPDTQFYMSDPRWEGHSSGIQLMAARMGQKSRLAAVGFGILGVVFVLVGLAF